MSVEIISIIREHYHYNLIASHGKIVLHQWQNIIHTRNYAFCFVSTHYIHVLRP
jgi:hypothetical protein